MDHIAKAKELGAALASTPEFHKLKEMEEEIKQQPDAWQALQEYQLREQSLTASRMFGKISSEKDNMALIDHKVRLINRYPIIRKYFNQQQAFDKLIATVNLTVTTSIYGMPSAQDLPIPDGLKDIAQQVLDKVRGGEAMPSLEIPENFNLPDELKKLLGR